MKKIYLTNLKKIKIFGFAVSFLFGLLFWNISSAQVVLTNPASPWTVPAGVTSVKVEVWGGGGAGGGSQNTFFTDRYGGGGGGGGFSLGNLTVIAGQTYTSTVGLGGTVPGANQNGGPGGASTFTGPGGTITAGGGGGGLKSTTSTGGAAGIGTTFNGGIGGTATGNGAGGGGGSGNAGAGVAGANTGTAAGGNGNPNAAPYKGGNGGAAQTGIANGNAGAIPAGGGGGGQSNSGTSSGGVGAAGQIVITYYLPATITSLGSTSGCVGTSITINGTNFLGTTVGNIKIGGTPVTSITSITNTQIVAVIGNGTTGNVTVTNPGGVTATSAATFTVNPLPSVAAIAGGSTNICAGSQTPAFTDATPSGTWSIVNGTGTASIAPTGIVTGITAGTVTVSYTVNNGTCSNTATQSLTIDGLPTATAGGSQTICQNGTATVSGANATNGTIAWTENGTGSITAGATTLTPTYTAAAGDAGNTVTLTMTVSSNNTCSPATATATYSVIVKAIPTASAGGSQTICRNGTATVSGASATNGTIAWTDNGAGSITSGANTLTPTYTAAAGDAGNTVTLTMTVSNSPCANATATYSVIVKGIPTASAGGSKTICQNGTATVNGANSSNGTILWTHNGAGTLTNATTLTPTYTAAAGDAGNTVTLTMTVSNPPCNPATATYSVIVKGTPTASAGGSQTICRNGTATVSGASATNGTIAWTDNGAGSITSGANTLTPTYTAAAGDAGNTVTLTMTVSNSPCANATATYTVFVKAIPTATAGGSKTICENGTATVSGATATNGTILWTHNGAGTLANATTLTPTYTAAPGDAGNTVILTMTVSNAPCSPATATYSVIVKALPTASAGGSQTICQNGTATVSGASATNGTIAWTDNGAGSITSGATTLTPTYTPTAADAGNTVTLTMTVSNSPCANATATYTVIVNKLPTASAGGSQAICPGGTATVSGANAADGTILWTHNGLGSLSNATTLTPTYTSVAGDGGNTVTLTMTVTSANVCSPATAAATYTVIVNPTPVVTTSNTKEICNGANTNIALTASVPSNFTWTIGTVTGGITGAIGGSGSTISNVLTNPSNSVSGSVEYIVTPTSTTGSCDGAPYTITVTVDPSPVVTTANTAIICSGTGPGINLTATAPSNFTWTIGTITGGITGATAGSGSIINQTLTNPGNTTSGTVEYLVKPTATTGSCAGATYTITVTVNPKPVVTTPNTVSICTGTSPNISLTASASSTFTWTVGAITGGITGANPGSGFSINDILTNPNPSLGGTVKYLVTPTSDDGCAGATYTITVTVNAPAAITTQPDPLQEACATFPVNFTVQATGTGLTYQWYKRGSPDILLTDDANISGSNTKTLHLDQAAGTDAGTYYVIVSGLSPCGTVQSDDAVLNVNQEIFINTQPAPQTLCAGGDATFTIDASGTGISYQWRKGTTPLADGGRISGATGLTLTITGVVAGDAGNYNVVLTSPGGACPQAISANAKLTVNPLPTVNVGAAPTDICQGGTSANLGGSFGGSATGAVWSDGLTGPTAGTFLNNTGTTPGTAKYIASTTAPATVTLTLTTTGGPCGTTSASKTITINPLPTVNAGGATAAVCQGGTTAALGGSFGGGATGAVWSDGLTGPNAGTFTNNGGATPGTATYTASTTAPATITLTLTTNGGSCATTSATKTITINPLPAVNVGGAVATICQGATSGPLGGSFGGGATGAVWSDGGAGGTFANNGGSTPGTTTYTASATAPATITLTLTSSGGLCGITSDTKTLSINPLPTVDAGPAIAAICQGGTTVPLGGSFGGGATSAVWSDGGAGGSFSNNGGATPGTATYTASATSSTPVTLTLTTAGGACGTTSASKSLTVNKNVTISPLSQSICTGNPITPIAITGLPAGAITSWSATTPAGITSTITNGGTSLIGTLSNSTGSAITVTFTINATATNGCATTTTATVTVDGKVGPPVIAASQVLCGSSAAAPLTSTPATGGSGTFTYQWQQSATLNGVYTNIVGATGATYTPPSTTGYYRLVATDSALCGAAISDTVQITKSADIGGTLSESGKPTTPLCNGASFTYNINSTSLFSIFSNYYLRYSWSATPAANVTSPTLNPFGVNSTCYVFIIIPYDCFPGSATFTVNNPTNAPITANIQVTPSIYNGSNVLYCNLTPLNIPVTINPTPTVNAVANQVVCKGGTAGGQSFSGTVSGTVYNWTNNTPSIGLPASGTGPIPSFTAANPGTAPLVARITVTPSYTNPGGGAACTGTAQIFTITVNPTPTVTATPASQTICSGGTSSIALSSNVAGATFSWTVVQTGVTGATAGSGSSIGQALTATGTADGTAVYTITPSANSCPGTPITATITVTASVNAGAVSGTTPICKGGTTTYTTTGNNATGTWSSSNTSIATVNPSTGLVTGINNGTANIVYTISSGCNSPASSFQPITVSPDANPGVVSGTSPLCIGATANYTSDGDAGGTWSSSDPSVATVDGTTGIVTALSSGTTDIIYTPPGCNVTTSKKTLTVSPDANPGIVSGTSPFCIGVTDTYTSGGDPGGSWSSSDPSVATVNSTSGLVTALTAGTTDIIYTVSTGCNNPVSSLKTLTVNPNADAGTLTGTSPICIGTQVLYTSSGDAGGLWSTSDPSVATVSSTGAVKGIGSGIATITYTITTGCSVPVSATKDVLVQSLGAVSALGPISGPISVCKTSTGFVYSVVPNINATSYVWTVPAGWTITAGATTNSITVSTSATAANGNITVKGANICGFSPVSSLAVTATAIGQWIGITSDWNDPQNWCTGAPPTPAINVTIPVVGPTFFYPIVSTVPAATVNNITIVSGAFLTVTGQTMQIGGTITNGGTFDATNGSIELNGASQSISGAMFKNRMIKDLIVTSGGTGLTVSNVAGDTLNITESLTFGNGTSDLLTGGNITLKSTASGTASIGVVAAGNTISGDVNVERYIGAGPLHGKSWQLLAIPTSGPNPVPGTDGQTIKQAWQEGATAVTGAAGGDPHPGYGTMLTSTVANATTQTSPGFDALTTPGPSIKTYNSLTDDYSGPLTTAIPIYNQKGYFVLVRGDRSRYTSAAPANPTVLRTKGQLFTPAHLAPVTNVAANVFGSVGNPYASAIDLRNLSITGGVKQFYTVWDPKLGGAFGLGAFQTLGQTGSAGDLNFYASPGGGSYGSAAHNFIQSGQAFLIQTNTTPVTGGSLSFKESDKAAGSDALLLRPQAPAPVTQAQLRTSLNGFDASGNTFLADGVLIQYNDTYSNSVDGLDARKIANTNENLAIKTGGKLLVIERRHTITQQDTIFLNLTGMSVQQYQFQFNADNLNISGIEGFLEDTYLHTKTAVSLTGATIVNFSVDNVAGSYAPDRFMIVFKPSVVLPVTFTSVKAYREDKNINVEWRVENEINMKQYEVEKSINGTQFTTLAVKAAAVNGGRSAVYVTTDITPVVGYNYYRIRSVDINGKTAYTNVVKVLMSSDKQDITIVPNPITDGMIHLQLMNQPAGKYGLRLLNKLGQVIVSRQITHADGSSTELIKWDFNLAHGMYQLEVTKPDGVVKDINVLY